MHAARTALPLALLVLACTPKPDDGDDTTAGTGTGSTGDGASASDTSASTPDPTTGDGGETGVTATVPATTGEPDPTTGEPDPTTGEPDPTGSPDVPTACEAMCTQMDDCFAEPEQPHDECVADCVGSFAGPECPPAAAEFWQCVADMSCEELLKFIDEGPTDECVAELGAVDRVCSECGTFGAGDGADSCSIGRECEDTEEYVCVGDTCTCTENGVPGVTCPADGFCAADFETMEQTAQDCCGWVWP